ncbi:MAG: NADPH-dependent glutamate synthase [Spirochaetaceae bacterium]|jgi:glutamate synthase (NADPH/NADH) small chain|nr:NADPH-dependent glutamate synthase [Spirochaetaceae bacterium]
MSYKNPEELTKEAKDLLKDLQPRIKELKAKDRMAIPQMDMPSQNPQERSHNQQEVALGYSPEAVQVEALRCMDCKTAPCIKGCPVAIDIPGFIRSAAEGNFQESVDIIKESSLLPAICGRVCPQESQCMELCTLGKSLKDPMKSVAIGRIERYVADLEGESGKVKTPEVAPDSGFKVAVVGSGPAGLTAAADLRKAGHRVEIFEAFHKPGGVMIYGIPEFRLPKAIVKKEIDTLKEMGVLFHQNFLIGRTRTIEDLLKKDKFDALFIGSGAGLPRFMNIPGENLVGVFSANEYLTRANLMKAYDKENVDTPIYDSKKVAVLGAGNVAMDSARMALRLGAEEVNVIYRRTRKEMPARAEEVDHAEEEGIKFHFLCNPVEILGDEKGKVKALKCQRYELGEPDDSGRRRPVPLENDYFELDMDTVIPALGNVSNPLIRQTTGNLDTNKWGNIVVDDQNRTSIPGVYAGGDIVLGAATVILAMGEGRTAAATITDDLANK